MSECTPLIPDGWLERLEPFIVFEFALSVFDCDMTNDHCNEEFFQEVAESPCRKIGDLVVQFGWASTKWGKVVAIATLM